MNKYMKSLIWGILLLFFSQISVALPPGELSKINDPWATMIVDNSSYIHANYIFMLVTNHGSFGRDIDGVFFRHGNGTYYPYLSIDDIANALWPKSPLYAAGLWIGGKVDGEIRIAATEYASEFVPGPMVGGTFQPDRPEFKVYKLHRDSLGGNPNDDYTNWPTDQGAQVNSANQPIILGDQFLWTVFNDADPAQHVNVDPGGTLPLGIEIQQQIWGTYQEGSDISIYNSDISITQLGNSQIQVNAEIVEPNNITGNSYQVIIEGHPQFINVWHLINITTGDTLLLDQTDFSGSASQTVEGLVVKVKGLIPGFAEFSVVANANGPIDPPEAGAAEWAGFPVPLDLFGDPLQPTDNQQVGEGKWLFHMADNGGSSGGGTFGNFDAFVSNSVNFELISIYDYEMRFTGDNSNPGIGGSWAIELQYQFENDVFWVPFELWRTGINTPDDTSDDVRLIPLILDAANAYTGDFIYALESFGVKGSTCSGKCEHSVASGDDDPYTDLVYWCEPKNLSPGEAGYLAHEILLLDTVPGNDYVEVGREVFSRTVLVNWDGGEIPPFTQDVPEQGTIFRITTEKYDPPVDSFEFVAQPSLDETTGFESAAIYIQYKIYNKSQNTIEDCFFTLWVDPDLGGAGDDFIGCDTMANIFFCYNADNDDSRYGSSSPAIGFKLLTGPLVASPGNQAVFNGNLVNGFKNLNLYSFLNLAATYDPDHPHETYNSMLGLWPIGNPYTYNGAVLRYMQSGDPVSGTGDLDRSPADRRMMGTTGPVTMQPGDSQYVLIKIAVGQGTDRLNSITVMKEILNSRMQAIITGDANSDSKLNVADAVFLINYIFRGGSAPGNMTNNDVNCDGTINVADAVFLINHIFRGGSAPDCP
ncbi:MAG: dockerin type I repeat-containing protein [candidate division Zixibacteria bacterium]